MTQAVLEAQHDILPSVADVRRITAQSPDSRERSAQRRPLIERVVADPSRLPPASMQLHPNGHTALDTLRVEADRPHALSAVMWPGHHEVPPHEYGTRALMAGLGYAFDPVPHTASPYRSSLLA
jgi:hypothetical protein